MCIDYRCVLTIVSKKYFKEENVSTFCKNMKSEVGLEIFSNF